MLAQGAEYIYRVPLAGLFVLLAYFLIPVVEKRLRRTMSRVGMAEAICGIAVSGLKFVLWICVLAGAFQILKLDKLSLALAGSAAAVAFALASGASQITNDILSGILLITDQDFKVGRRIKAGAVEGIVREVGVRKTRIEDAEGQIHVVPNRTIDAAAWKLVSDEEDEGGQEAEA